MLPWQLPLFASNTCPTGQHLCLYQLLHNWTIKSVRQGLEQQTVNRGSIG